MTILTSAASNGGSTASLCLEDPKPERLASGFSAGSDVRVSLEGCVDEIRTRDGHADLELSLTAVSVRPEGRRKSITGLIEEKQQRMVR